MDKGDDNIEAAVAGEVLVPGLGREPALLGLGCGSEQGPGRSALVFLLRRTPRLCGSSDLLPGFFLLEDWSATCVAENIVGVRSRPYRIINQKRLSRARTSPALNAVSNNRDAVTARILKKLLKNDEDIFVAIRD